MELLEVKNICKRLAEAMVVDGISFLQREGQKVAIAGETGSGKTSLVKIIAGLGQADEGEVYFAGQRVKGTEEKMMAGHPGIAYLSQYFELPKKYRVDELMDYANDLSEEQSLELYKVCRIDHLMKRWSQTLSGGERQRVALARLLTEVPKLLVLDEPFSNLDHIHRQQLKKVIEDISDKLSITCLLVSHSAEDIMPWADEVLVMKDGQIIQQGSPEQIYRRPETEYTAALFGRYSMPSEGLLKILATDEPFLRPEQIVISKDGHGLPAIVRKIRYMGSHYEAELEVLEEVLLAKVDAILKCGSTVNISTVSAK